MNPQSFIIYIHCPFTLLRVDLKPIGIKLLLTLLLFAFFLKPQSVVWPGSPRPMGRPVDIATSIVITRINQIAHTMSLKWQHIIILYVNHHTDGAIGCVHVSILNCVTRSSLGMGTRTKICTDKPICLYKIELSQKINRHTALYSSTYREQHLCVNL